MDNNEKRNELVAEKSTLKNSLEKLNQRNYELTELAGLSSQLLNKFLNPRNEPMDEKASLAEKQRQPDTLVEVFDDVSKRMNANINIIGNNLERVLGMID